MASGLGIKTAFLMALCGTAAVARLPDKLQYLRAKGSGLYLHTSGGTTSGHRQTLHPCPKHRNHPNCFFELEPAYDGRHYYIKASDARLYVHVNGGNYAGHGATLHPCHKNHNHPNCQFEFEPSPTDPTHYYIRAKGTSLYLHANGGNHGGSQITLHPCPKGRDHPNCQWELQPHCADVKSAAQCSHFKQRNGCGWYKSFCMKTCNYCVTGAASGYWKKGPSLAGGTLTFDVKAELQTTTGVSVTSTVGVEVTTTVGAALEFGPLSNSVEVSTSVRNSLSRSVSNSLTQVGSTSVGTSCAARPGQTVTLYRWVIETDKYVVETEHYRCHFTDGAQRDPECPYGYCGSNNEFCEASKCPRGWKAVRFV